MKKFNLRLSTGMWNMILFSKIAWDYKIYLRDDLRIDLQLLCFFSIGWRRLFGLKQRNQDLIINLFANECAVVSGALTSFISLDVLDIYSPSAVWALILKNEEINWVELNLDENIAKIERKSIKINLQIQEQFVQYIFESNSRCTLNTNCRRETHQICLKQLNNTFHQFRPSELTPVEMSKQFHNQWRHNYTEQSTLVQFDYVEEFT